MSRDDLGLALSWAAAEGWNPGLHDAGSFHAADPDGFFIGELGGEPVGCISAVAYDDRFGFLGLYIVRPEFRGRGFGLALWRAGMTYLGNRNIGLDGVVAQQANYTKSGFTLAYRNIRYEGIGGGPASSDVIDLATLPFEIVAQYDRQLFPSSRDRFLRSWLAQAGRTAIGVLENDRLRGYGVLRPCRRGYKVGPLFADDDEIAGRIYRGLSASIPGEPIFLDVPEVNRGAVALAARAGMSPVFETARMYTKRPPDTPMNRVYGVTTFELG